MMIDHGLSKDLTKTLGAIVIVFIILAAIYIVKTNREISNLKYQLEIINDDSGTKIPKELQPLKNDIILYIKNKYPTIPDILIRETAKQIIIISMNEHISPELLMGIIEVESSFNPMAISSKNARGLMQVMPEWTKYFKLKTVCELHNVKTGILIGTKVFKIHLKEQDGDIQKALYCYVNKDKTYVDKIYNSVGRFIIFNKTH